MFGLERLGLEGGALSSPGPSALNPASASQLQQRIRSLRMSSALPHESETRGRAPT